MNKRDWPSFSFIAVFPKELPTGILFSNVPLSSQFLQLVVPGPWAFYAYSVYVRGSPFKLVRVKRQRLHLYSARLNKVSTIDLALFANSFSA